MPSYYEFFAGGGMVRAGLGQGWRCLFANDFDHKKGRVYRENWEGEELKTADIGSVSAKDLPAIANLAWAVLNGRRSGILRAHHVATLVCGGIRLRTLFSPPTSNHALEANVALFYRNQSYARRVSFSFLRHVRFGPVLYLRCSDSSWPNGGRGGTLPPHPPSVLFRSPHHTRRTGPGARKLGRASNASCLHGYRLCVSHIG